MFFLGFPCFFIVFSMFFSWFFMFFHGFFMVFHPTPVSDMASRWVNPRFVHLDESRTLSEALEYSCFRFKQVTDLEGEVLFELEHEARGD